jgi:cation diffusion facilitator CzcD-associated flavoprotein CzcO
VEHLDVLIVGAGLSGIGAAHHLQTECPWADYAIFEARDSIGGTWDLFRYPGVRSDSDMFTLGYSFKPWTGEKSIADGWSILEYIKDTARDAGIDTRIRFNHRIVSLDWSTERARWVVTARRTTGDDSDPGTGETFQLTCGFVMSCTGYYRYDHGYEPRFEGAEQFSGDIVHPQHWPEHLDYSGKRVVVIGSGATAVTLVPSLAEEAAQVTMVQRSPSYVASLPAKNPLSNFVRRVLPNRWSGPAVRWLNALLTMALYQLCRRRPQMMKRVLLKGVEKQLPAGYDVATHFTPDYDPWDQRMCLVPDGDLFRAISSGSAEVVTDRIERFTERGLRLASGAELEADIIVTATGLEVLFLGGMELSVDGDVIDPASKLVYKGMMLDGVPNLAFAIGYTNASWTLRADLISDYVCRLLNALRDSGNRQATAVNRDAVIGAGSVFDLNSGYVLRAADRLPKSGSNFPWQVRQNYLFDYRVMKRTDVTGDVMVFSNPSTGAEQQPVAAAPLAG